MNLYTELEAQVLPALEAYKDDLLVHDKKFITDNPGVPFLHYTRRTGTTIIPLHAPETYPKKGVKIPYLLGEADREHILENSLVSMAEYHTNTLNGTFVCRFYNGERLRSISVLEAVKIAKRHAQYVRANWDNF